MFKSKMTLSAGKGHYQTARGVIKMQCIIMIIMIRRKKTISRKGTLVEGKRQMRHILSGGKERDDKIWT